MAWSSPPAVGRQGRPQQLRARAAPPGHHPEKRPPQPPADPGQSRTVPADPQELAGRPITPARHPRRPASPPERLHPLLQHPPATPLAAAPGHPRHRLPGPAQSHPRTHVLLLAQDRNIRIINAATGELLRQLTPGPTRNYQPTGRPPRPTPTNPRQRKNPEP